MNKTKGAVLSLLLCVVLFNWAISGTLGPNSPAASSGNNWSNPTWVFSSDNQRAVYNNTSQDTLIVSNFGFSAAEGAITGIKVEIEGYGLGFPPPTGNQIDVALTKNGSAVAGNWKTAVELPYSVSFEMYVSCGNSGDLWGASWNFTDVTSTSFGVFIRDYDDRDSDLYIDHVRITIYYTTQNPARRLKIQKSLLGE